MDEHTHNPNQEPGEQIMLPTPHRLTREQLLLTGGTLLTSGLADMAMHGGGTGIVVGLLATFVVARHGGDLLDALVPGRDAARVVDATARVVEAAAPMTAADDEQAVLPKLKRLFRLQSPAPALPQETVDEEELEPMPEREPRQIVGPEADRYDPALHRDCLYLGSLLHPHAGDVLSKRIGLFGVPGSGKSNGLAVFCEALGKLDDIGVPFVLADTEGEAFPLCSRTYLMRPVYAHAGNLSPTNAFQFGQDILEHGYQVILDLQSYADDDEAALVMIELIRGLRAWAEARPNDERATCMFILDEAAIWLPQRENESSLSKERDEQGLTLLARLQRAFFGTVVRRGRKRGIGFLFATQRPADLDKRCISCDWLILFRQTFPNDLNKYAELGVPKDVAQALATGEAWVIDPHGNQGVYQFRRRYSPDNAQSPGLSSLHQHAARWETAAPQSREETVQWAARTALPPMQSLPMKAVPVMEASSVKPVRLSALYQRALDAYEPGMSYRVLGEKIGVGKDKAGDIIQDLKKRGLIANEDEDE